MSWSRHEVGLLTDEYKKYPCLYATKSKEYKNKHARGRALQNIEAELLPKRRKMDRTNILEDAGKAIKLVGEALQQRTQNKKISRDEVDIFGDFVSTQLRKIHPTLKDDVEQEISMVLFNNIKKSKQLYNNETVFLD
ncbi:hypothetical protein FQA39_LY02855 [Lamprigera yunnana]|nr:hypothetical protein FQA39_LY02855 [Lamprigera yunnana]